MGDISKVSFKIRLPSFSGGMSITGPCPSNKNIIGVVVVIFCDKCDFISVINELISLLVSSILILPIACGNFSPNVLCAPIVDLPVSGSLLHSKSK